MTKLKFKNETGFESPNFLAKFEDTQKKTFDSNVDVVVADNETAEKVNYRGETGQKVGNALNDERPKSASCIRSVSPLLQVTKEKRPKSCCSLLKEHTEREEETEGKDKQVKKGRSLFQIKSVNEPNDRLISIDSPACWCCHCSSRDFCQRRSCEMFDLHHSQKSYCFCGPLPGHLPQCNCHNIPSFSTDKTKEFSNLYHFTYLWNYKRSLKLLGFQPSDFGIQPRVISERSTSRKCRPHSNFSNKIVSRSYSLDCLRETIREALIEDRIDTFHRKILAQAAYEEWYFKKEKEFLNRRRETKLKEVENKENLEENLRNKEEKAKQEFQKWIQRKRIKLKENSESPKKAIIVNNKFTRRNWTPEEIEKAYLKWKKEKDSKLLSKNKEKKKEEEMKVEMEKQKREQKVLAEKAYQQWKAKMEEKAKMDMKKKLKGKELQESELKKKKIRQKESQSSFDIWKAIKDEQLQKRIQHNKVAAKLEKEKRQALLEERLYEADQAFEDWLKKIDLRIEKKYCKSKMQHKKLPWLPP